MMMVEKEGNESKKNSPSIAPTKVMFMYKKDLQLVCLSQLGNVVKLNSADMHHFNQSVAGLVRA